MAKNKVTQNPNVSRQRLKQRQLIADGLCRSCGKPRNLYSSLCDPCADKWRGWQRRRLGCKEWKPGGRGRPPKHRSKT